MSMQSFSGANNGINTQFAITPMVSNIIGIPNNGMVGIHNGVIQQNITTPMNYNMAQNNAMMSYSSGAVQSPMMVETLSNDPNIPRNILIQRLENFNYKFWESELLEFYCGQNDLYIFPKIGKFKNPAYINSILSNHICTSPLNVEILNSYWRISGINFFGGQPTDKEIICFCEQMRAKNIFLNLDKSNFINTSMGIFIKNPDCFLIRPNISGIYFFPKCPEFHNVTEDFTNGLFSEDKIYFCPSCNRYYHKSAIKFDLIKHIIEEIK